MCRSIKRLNLKNQPPTEEEIFEAARQYIRKISGFRVPSAKNKVAFEKAVEEVAKVSRMMLNEILIIAANK